MLREAMRLGYMAADPSKSVRQLRETPEERRILTLAEIRLLFDEMETASKSRTEATGGFRAPRA
jgi:hypothetical protein